MGDRFTRLSPAKNVVDWTTIRGSKRSFTFEELSNYSRTKFSPYIVELVQALCTQFTIAAIAKSELSATWRNLPLVDDPSLELVVNNLAASEHGSVALGICAVLNARFQPEALTMVFEALANSSLIPDDLRPEKESFAELSRVCGDLQPLDMFRSLAEKYTQLGLPNETAVADNSTEAQNAKLVHTGSMCVAEGLQVMSRLCSGEETQPIMILGGCDAGWFAAVAEWMFGLNIKIETEDGKIVFASGDSLKEPVQLTLVFHNPGVPCDGIPVEDSPLSPRA